MTISEKQEKRRKEIAMAVREIMQKTNFSKITVDDICNATGIAKGTFYHYFSSKDSLLDQIAYPIDDFFASFEDELTENLSFLDAINQYTENYATYVTTSGPEMCHTVIQAMLSSGNKRFVSHDRTAVNILFKIISAGQERGEVTTEYTAQQICDMFVVVLRGYLLNWAANEYSYDLVETITTHFRLFAPVFCTNSKTSPPPAKQD